MESPQPKNARDCGESIQKFALKSEIAEEVLFLVFIVTIIRRLLTPTIIFLQDLFSNLSYDCLLETFSWLDQ